MSLESCPQAVSFEKDLRNFRGIAQIWQGGFGGIRPCFRIGNVGGQVTQAAKDDIVSDGYNVQALKAARSRIVFAC